MHKPRMGKLSALVAVAAISLPLFAGTISATASPRATPPIGKQLAKLTGADTFGTTVAISGPTAIVGAPHFADTGAAYLFEG